ncbi:MULTISPECIES: magnesium/cobalt transporter CorA [unclassified Polynucleobacter]|jgi:magnesium transporter|uniref:magnesium/cobalt transporter CorA n=1 Tax=unclassified Polynucleobacter TaxID=2640945 RepID=UPI000925D7A1|nr:MULTISPECIES: magnesium/cobalt transporter CorA [unclassified Polynucleobacter]MBU3538140.1 magnesium/cobalt transporter CorA [Polynucleobacter sp. UK-Gri1-W3]MBU3547752.1 magnesium/cobalt transporter CorA [Polynucleobacter sp. P1-05-14]MBU3563515.1 magnesium/cobalt transporter CorA [Polynucleobacter sp. Tro8-14-1]MBU3638437.1 magnesium/cobalt transporter CorA [Polynucleobacter sp. AP-RePozz3-80-G7]MBU3641178.1 magnesium/cobalt transporter CorA [Polynucleobacter sp. Fuers-14]
MINLFVLQNGRLSQEQVEDRNELLQYANPIWIDVVDPEEEELIWIKEAFGVLLPELDDLGDLEASARYFEADDGHLHIRTDFLLDEEETSRNVRVAFVLTKQVLFSIHDEDLPVFRLVRLRARLRPGSVSNAKDVLLDLYSTDAEYSADALEEVYENLEQAGKRVLQDDINDADAEQVLETIAKEEDTNGRIRRNVMDTRRALSFLMRSKLLSDEQQEEARQILRDIDSLENHTAFLFDKINFLMDATVGFINLNQSKIIKIFSVVSVALMPPTLLASIWGMNYKHMPELDATWGYPMAIVAMVISAIIPLWYFHSKGWMK